MYYVYVACQKTTTGSKGVLAAQNDLSITESWIESGSKNNYKTAKTSFLAMRGNVCGLILFLIFDYKEFLFHTAI